MHHGKAAVKILRARRINLATRFAIDVVGRFSGTTSPLTSRLYDRPFRVGSVLSEDDIYILVPQCDQRPRPILRISLCRQWAGPSTTPSSKSVAVERFGYSSLSPSGRSGIHICQAELLSWIKAAQ